jgi:hypothetical protein
MLVMVTMMAASGSGTCTTRCHRRNGWGEQKGKAQFQYAIQLHYADLQRVETAVWPSWFDVFVGKAGRLIDQCGDKRALPIRLKELVPRSDPDNLSGAPTIDLFVY